MRGARATIAIVSTLAACFSRVPNQRYAERTQHVDALYLQGVDEIERSYRSELKRISTIGDALVAVEEDGHGRPVEPVADRPGLAELASACEELEVRLRSTPDARLAGLARDCIGNYNRHFIDALMKAYWAADVDWIAQSLRGGEQVDIEALFVYSHNLRVRAYMEAQRNEAAAARRTALRQLGAARDQAIAAAAELRDLEIAENKRNFGLAVAAGLQAMGEAASGRAPAGAASHGSNDGWSHGRVVVDATQSADECSSDFSCGAGRVCIKDNYASRGVCARAVNEYGVQTFDLPRMESVMVKVPSDADCHFDLDCPIGFRCQQRSGACVR